MWQYTQVESLEAKLSSMRSCNESMPSRKDRLGER
jgi:hypothetical protein